MHALPPSGPIAAARPRALARARIGLVWSRRRFFLRVLSQVSSHVLSLVLSQMLSQVLSQIQAPAALASDRP